MKYRNELTLGGQKILFQTDISPTSPKTTWDAQRHCHPTFEIHIILSGCCQVEAGTGCFSMEKGSALLIPPGIYHRPLSYSQDFYRFNLTISPGHTLWSFLKDCTVFPVSAEVCRLCRELLLENTSANPYKAERTQALMTLLAVELLRILDVPTGKVAKPLPVTDLERFSVIDDFFEKHFADVAGEEALALALHLSKRQLARVLEKHYGMTFRQKMLGARMDRAAWLLRSTDQTVSHIAGEVGYNSESTFFQVFRRHFGMTPQQYRLQNK